MPAGSASTLPIENKKCALCGGGRMEVSRHRASPQRLRASRQGHPPLSNVPGLVVRVYIEEWSALPREENPCPL